MNIAPTRKRPRTASMFSGHHFTTPWKIALLLSCCANDATNHVIQGERAAGHRRARRPPFPAYRMHGVDGAVNKNSYFERNGMKPPPPPTPRSSIRRAQTSNETNDLDSIIADAKNGDDPNTRLRYDLVWNTLYDRNSYPWEYAWHGKSEGNLTGVQVQVDVNFHSVYSVNTINPVLDLIVWFGLTWVDPRLTWNPQDYGNHTKTWFWIDGGNGAGEMSEIWTPDIELWNLEEGLSSSLEDANAVVKHDGTVYWNRPGHLRPACKFTGLEKFPFDHLSCTLELGSWSYSGKYVSLVKGGEDQSGFSTGGSVTAGESYHEFSFAQDNPITCELHTYPPFGANSPESGWPVILYNVTLERSWQPYARGYIYQQVLISIIGFSTFWLPPSCGERMGLSITAMLASIASDIVIATNIPQARELTWFQKFSMMTSMFTFLALIESVAVLHFFYSKSDNMVPNWYTCINRRRVVRQAQKGNSHIVVEPTGSNSHTPTNPRDTALVSLKGTREKTNNGQGSEFECERISQDDQLPQSLSRENASDSIVVPDVDAFINEDEVNNNRRWKEVAVRIDDMSKFWFPLSYSIVLAIILSEAF